MCVTDRHDMTLAVKMALNPNTTDLMQDTQNIKKHKTKKTKKLQEETTNKISVDFAIIRS